MVKIVAFVVLATVMCSVYGLDFDSGMDFDNGFNPVGVDDIDPVEDQPSLGPVCNIPETDVCIAVQMTSSSPDLLKEKLGFVKSMVHGVQDQFPQTAAIRFGAVAFGGKVVGESALTRRGRRIFKWFQTQALKSDGANIPRALKRCGQLFGDSTAEKVVVLISDGNARDKDGMQISAARVIKAGKRLKKNNVVIFTVGSDAAGFETVLEEVSGLKTSDVKLYSPITDFTAESDFTDYAKKLIPASC